MSDHKTTPNWKSLATSRNHLHWLSQALALYADQALPREPDWDHYALRWNTARQALETADGLLRLELATAQLQVGNDVLVADGRSIQDVLDWVGERVHRRFVLDALPHPMPPHELRSGPRFRFDDFDSLAVWSQWYEFAASSLAPFGEVRVWSHHFDMATVVAKGLDQAQVGAGMSPGDDEINSVYFYVTPWPPPKDGLPELEVGCWHQGGWTGAVLPDSEVKGSETPDRLVGQFLSEAIAAAKRMVGIE